MNLVETVSGILNRNVTEEEAKAYALDNFGLLATFIREKVRVKVINSEEILEEKVISVEYSLKDFEAAFNEDRVCSRTQLIRIFTI